MNTPSHNPNLAPRRGLRAPQTPETPSAGPGQPSGTVQSFHAGAQGFEPAPDPAHNPLAVLRAWLVDAAGHARHNALHARIPEARLALDGMAAGHERTILVIDRLVAGGRLPTVGGLHPSACPEHGQDAVGREAGR